MPVSAYDVYSTAIRLFLEAYYGATPGLLHYHVGGDIAGVEACLAHMVALGEIEQYDVEKESQVYQGQPVYRLRSETIVDSSALFLPGGRDEQLP